MANHPRRSRRPNIEEFHGASTNNEGLKQIGRWVLIPDYDITAPIGSGDHLDYRARRDARLAYYSVTNRGDSVRDAYAAARAVLREHLSLTGRRTRWQIGDGQYLEP